MTGLTGKVPLHPAEYSPEVLVVIEELLRDEDRPVFDCFAGRGVRLGALCDQLGLEFSGTDIESYPEADHRVDGGDSTLPLTYPSGDFVVATSPVYFGNRISSDYVNGPTPRTKLNGRRAYGISTGRPLAGRNLARFCRQADHEAYYELHGRAVRHWGDRAIVNVDSPLCGDWTDLLEDEGFEVVDIHEAQTRRYVVGNGANSKRADFEVVIEAVR